MRVHAGNDPDGGTIDEEEHPVGKAREQSAANLIVDHGKSRRLIAHVNKAPPDNVDEL